MHTRAARYFLLALIAISTSASNGQAQTSFWSDLLDPNCGCVQMTLSEEALFMSRSNRLNVGPILRGPDRNRTSFDNADFDYNNAFRVAFGVDTPETRVEAIFADYGDWAWRRSGSLTAGLAFDGGVGPAWPAASNFLTTNTFFSQLSVASTAALGGEGDEFEGLGPNTAFADSNPTFSSYYFSRLEDFELNLLDNDPCSEVRFGIGYRHLNLEELAGVNMAGTFRATDVAGPNGGLSNATLTGIGGLNLLSGTANGFEDESALGNAGAADTLTLEYEGRVTNKLNGCQLIMDSCLMDNGRFDVTTFVKAGVYHNQTTGRVREQYTGTGDDTSVYGRTLSDTKDSVSFAGGVAVRAGYQLTRHFRVIGGYEGLFLGDVALAPEQSDGVRNGVYEVQTNGNTVVHGGSVGLELTY